MSLKKGRLKGTKIEITGNKAYVARLSKHLRKEHPSTRKRMKVS